MLGEVEAIQDPKVNGSAFVILFECLGPPGLTDATGPAPPGRLISACERVIK
jgi:hypothetical protein